MIWPPSHLSKRLKNILLNEGILTPTEAVPFLERMQTGAVPNAGSRTYYDLEEELIRQGVLQSAPAFHRLPKPKLVDTPPREPGASVWLLSSEIDALIALSPNQAISDKLAKAKTQLR